MRPPESFIQQPVRSLQTMLRVLAEDDPRLPTVVPDGIYGNSTVTAITTFQRLYGLPVTGVTDQTTWEHIVDVYDNALVRVDKAQPIEIIMDANQIYRLGDTGPYIYLLQSILIQLSKEHAQIPSPEHNGVFDNRTAEGLEAFQRFSDLPETGELDKNTWKALALQYALFAHHKNAHTQRKEY